MNHIHRLVFNASTNTWTAVAENARGRGKGSSRKLVAAALSLAVGLAQAAPLGGTVLSGAGSIAQTGSATIGTGPLLIAPKSLPESSQCAVNHVPAMSVKPLNLLREMS